MHFSWDGELLSDTPGFELNASGISDVADAEDCKDGLCVGIPQGGYMQLAPHNFGQYPGLTFSFWYKAKTQSGSDARVIAFGQGKDQDNIVIGRQGNTNNLLFAVRSNVQGKVSSCLSIGNWQTNVWKHVVWTLAPTTGSPPYTDSIWEIYVDGEWSISSSGAYPVNADLTVNYFGKSNSPNDGAFVGYIDSFLIFQFTAAEDQIILLMNVSCEVKQYYFTPGYDKHLVKNKK